MKIYTFEFDGIWPVPNGLIILAENDNQAMEIAKSTITHTEKFSIKEIIEDLNKPQVIFYESGDY